MKDGYGREIDYLRISLTDKCNLRCRYCMPPRGVRPLRHEDILTLEEIGRVAAVMASLGVKKIRLTGGEPLVRKGVLELVKILRGLDGIQELSMTTNGILLVPLAAPLKAAGLDSVNISLDTLDSRVYAALCGEDRLSDALNGIEAAGHAGLSRKINCVPVRGFNDAGLKEIAALARDTALDVRFIELMPLGEGSLFRGIASDELLSEFSRAFGKPQRLSGDISRGPAVYYRFPGFSGRVGFISPLSHKFCQSCNRVRLTAEGYLKLCLQYADGISLREPLRNGITDEALRELILSAVKRKPAAHSFSDMAERENSSAGCAKEQRKMVQIGG